MCPHTENLTELVRLLGHREGTGRASFLELACRSLVPRNSAALLWLWDPEHRQLVLNRHCVTAHLGKAAAPPRRRRAMLRSGLSTESCDRDPRAWTLGLDEQPEIDRWCADLGLTREARAYPVVASTDSNPAGDALGFLQVVAPMPDQDRLGDFLNLLATGLAGAIARRREQRQLRALNSIQDSFRLNISTNQLLQHAAETLREVVGAERCLVFRQGSDSGLRAVAAAPAQPPFERLVATTGSLTHRVSQGKKTYRLRDFQDRDERRRSFGSDQFDTRLMQSVKTSMKSNEVRAWMAAPIVIDAKHERDGHGVAVVMLLNKQGHLAEEFSVTDLTIVERVCQYLAGVIPSIEVYTAMSRISDMAVAAVFKEPENRPQLFDLLTELLPGVAYAGLIRRGPPSRTSGRIRFDKEIWFRDPVSEADGRRFLPLRDPPDWALRFVPSEYAVAIPDLEDDQIDLVVGFRRGYVNLYERRICAFLCKELSQAIRGEQHYQRSLMRTLEISHAVRAGLNGVGGHLTEALSYRPLLRGRPADEDPELESEFWAALSRSNLFWRRTQGLIEECRFLLKDLSSDQLRLGAGSVGALIEEVVDCLRPYARDRQLRITYANNFPPEFDRVSMDHQLVYILAFNLIDNAVKYSHRRAVDIYVELVGDRSWWRLRVTNYGVLIRKEDLRDIFKPFERRPTGDAATTRPGMGLGLPVAQRVAEVHGGRIDVTSVELRLPPEQMARTIFVVTLPTHPSPRS